MLKLIIFNPFVKVYLNSDAWFLNLNKRAKCITLEMWFTMSVFFPWLMVLMIPKFANTGNQYELLTWLAFPGEIMFGAMMVALLNKDFFNAQSAVHRKLGLIVVNARTGEPASRLKCMLRNITTPIWPVEVPFVFLKPQRRLGDLIAGTKLVDVRTSDPETLLTDIKMATLDRTSIITLTLSIAYVILLQIYFSP